MPGTDGDTGGRIKGGIRDGNRGVKIVRKRVAAGSGDREVRPFSHTERCRARDRACRRCEAEIAREPDLVDEEGECRIQRLFELGQRFRSPVRGASARDESD